MNNPNLAIAYVRLEAAANDVLSAAYQLSNLIENYPGISQGHDIPYLNKQIDYLAKALGKNSALLTPREPDPAKAAP